MGRALKVKPEPFFNRSYLVWITATGIFDNILIVMSKFVPLSWHNFFSFAVIFEPKILILHIMNLGQSQISCLDFMYLLIANLCQNRLSCSLRLE